MTAYCRLQEQEFESGADMAMPRCNPPIQCNTLKATRTKSSGVSRLQLLLEAGGSFGSQVKPPRGLKWQVTAG